MQGLGNIYDRNELLWGKDAQKRLFEKHVAVIGLGGVGSYVAEALARSGVGTLTLVDFDTVSETNINRQLPALIPNIGKFKTSLMKERISLINPHIRIIEINEFCSGDLMKSIIGGIRHSEPPAQSWRVEESHSVDKNNKILKQVQDDVFVQDNSLVQGNALKPDFVADAIDTIKAKITVLELCKQKKIPVITSLGAGNRIKPEELYLADISEVDVKKCPFVKNAVYLLKKVGIEKDLPVVASREKPFKMGKRSSLVKIKQANGEVVEFNKYSPGSSPFVPPVAGFIMASYIVRNLIL